MDALFRRGSLVRSQAATYALYCAGLINDLLAIPYTPLLQSVASADVAIAHDGVEELRRLVGNAQEI